jgi:hypothetical protein
MTGISLIQTLRGRGVAIRVDGDRLICKPKRLIEDLADEIRQHKASIIDVLERGEKAEEDRELTDYLIADIDNGGPYSRLLPQVRNYLRRTLPAAMVAEIELAFSGNQGMVRRLD